MSGFLRYIFSAACCLVLSGALAQPGSNCANAVNIGALPYSTPPFSIIPLDPQAHTTCGSTNIYTSAHACGNILANKEDYMYRFTPGAANNCIDIVLNGTGQPAIGTLDPDAAVFVFDGCPNLPTTNCVAQGVNMGAGQVIIAGLLLNPGTTYYIMVSGGVACFPYVLEVKAGGCLPPAAGSNCSNAIQVNSFPFKSGMVSTFNTVNDFNRGNVCQDKDIEGEDIVFHFKVNSPGCYNYRLTNINAATHFFLTRGCPNSPGSVCVARSTCAPPRCDQITEEINLNVPGDYYITVTGGQFGTTNFELELESGNIDDNLLCLTCNDSDNCTSCKNVSFEKLSFQGWQGFFGYYNNPDANPGLLTGLYNDDTTRHTIMTKGTYDQFVPTLSCVNPAGGDYSVRLGNFLFDEDFAKTGIDQGDGDSQALRYLFTVDENNTNFIYSYAVVLQDPGHGFNEQPYFSIRMHVVENNQLKEEIVCAKYEVRAGANVPGFKDANNNLVKYKDWTTVNIPLLPFLGKTVAVTFTSKDCLLDGHFGYAYIDAKCGKLEILREKDILCNEDSITLTAPEGFDKYKWNTGETVRTIVVRKSGTYSVEMTTVTGCKVVNQVYISKEEKPTVLFDFDFDCLDSTVKFTDKSIPGADSPITGWKWTFGDGSTSTEQHPTHKYMLSGNYSVTLELTTKNGCNSDTTIAVPLDLFIPPGLLNCIDTFRLCEGSRLPLFADTISFTVYKWTGPNGFTSGARLPVISSVLPRDSGWYRVTARIKDCIERYDSSYVIIEPLKPAWISPDTILCAGDSAILEAAGGDTYKWTPKAGLSADDLPKVTAKPPATLKYKVFMTNNICPDTSLFVNVKVLQGNVNLECPDTLRVCPGEALNLSANVTGFNSFLWTGPNGYSSTLPSPVLSSITPANRGYYRLRATITGNDCVEGRDSIYVDLHPLPVVNISPKPRELCLGDTITLNATGAATYRWTPAYKLLSGTTASPKVFPLKDTTYLVTGTSPAGCKNTDSVMVRVKPLPVVNLGPDQLWCLGDTAKVAVATAQYDSIRWSTGSQATAFSVINNAVYQLTAWKNSCKGSDDLKITFQDPGTFNIGPDSILCEGTAYTTNITQAADSAIWSDGVRTLNRQISSTGLYSVIVYSGKCVLTDDIRITYVPAPTFDIPDSTVCIGTTVTLDATDPLALRYEWSTGASTPVITAAVTGKYWVNLYTIRCRVTDTILITVVDPPLLDLGPEREICIGDSVQVISNISGDSYSWSTGDNTPGIWLKNAGAYSLTVRFGPCTLNDNVLLKVQMPLPLWLGNDTTLCENQQLTITAPPGFDSYNWKPAGTGRTISPTTSGLYSLVAVKGLCPSYDTIRVTFDTIPDFDLGPDRTICLGDSTALSSPLVADNYLWSTAETTSSIIVKNAGIYSLFIRNNTCSFTDQMTLFTVAPPSLYIGDDTTICEGAQATFGQVVPGAVYLWNTGDTTPFVSKGDAGIYELTITFSVCTVRDAAELIVNQYPDPNLGPDLLRCAGENITLDPKSSIGDKYLWSNNDTKSAISVGRDGTYWVEVANGNCISRDTVYLRFWPQHMVMLPPDFEICTGEKYDIQSITNAIQPRYEWNTGENTKDVAARTEGLYILTVTDSVCVARDTIYCKVNPLPDIRSQDYKLCPRDSIVFTLPAEYDYYFVNTHSPMDIRVLYPGTRLNFFVYTKKGCSTEAHVTAELDMNCEEDIYVPNAFTPNGDGANDVFKVYSFEMELHELYIFDRWGELLHFTTDPAAGWNGVFNEEKCKTDVYNWKLIYTDNYGRKKTVFGHVSLLR